MVLLVSIVCSFNGVFLSGMRLNDFRFENLRSLSNENNENTKKKHHFSNGKSTFELRKLISKYYLAIFCLSFVYPFKSC